MKQSVVQVDAFTDTPFAGNPAAVCVMPVPRDEAWMQAVAAEMNLAETAFVVPEAGAYRLRWFTPAREVDLCGHATVASAHVLWESGQVARDRACSFLTRSGPLEARLDADWIYVRFPAMPAKAAAVNPGVAAALGAVPIATGLNPLNYVLAEFDSEAAVRTLAPDFRALKKLPYFGVIATSRPASAEFDFISRFFAPNAGVDEDPVTGSAHCTLGPYWSAKLGKTEMRAYQASARGGVVRVRIDGDTVILGGQAVTTLIGELRC